jgi:ribosomal protein L37AE/L43A
MNTWLDARRRREMQSWKCSACGEALAGSTAGRLLELIRLHTKICRKRQEKTNG